MTSASPKKVGLTVLTAFLVFTAFYAESFILTHLEHEHDRHGAGGCCSLCSEIEQVLMLLEGFGRIVCAALAAVCVLSVEKRASGMAAVYRAGPTPVALKVRLNS